MEGSSWDSSPGKDYLLLVNKDHPLENDWMPNLKKMRDYFRTDIEQVKEYEIRNVDFTLKDGDVLCAVVKIEWLAEGLEGEERFETTHSVICEKQTGESDYKLVHFF